MQAQQLSGIGHFADTEDDGGLLMSHQDIDALREAVRQLHGTYERMRDQDSRVAEELAALRAEFKTAQAMNRENIARFYSKDWAGLQGEVSRMWARIGDLDRQHAGMKERMSLPLAVTSALVAIASVVAHFMR